MNDIVTLWNQAFNEAIGAEQESSASNPVDWRAGGRATKEYPNKEDGDWWNAHGLKMFQDFTEVWEQTGWSVWVTPEGIPALELEVNVHYGETLVKAFIDLVAVTRDGELIVVDFKTGKSMPSNMQLGLYASSIEKQFGVRPVHGYYYDARKAQTVLTQNLGRWTPALFTELFKQFELGVSSNIFLPNVGMSCPSCSVGDYCYANGGQFADMLDPLSAIARKKEESNE
jgi:putative RecB family exonuclease